MATHSSVLAWRIPGTAEPGCHLWGRTELDTTEAAKLQQKGPDTIVLYVSAQRKIQRE